MRLWPDTLAARTISLLLGITLLMLIGSAIMLKDERRERFEERGRFHVTERLTTLVRILDVTDPDSRQRVLKQLRLPGDEVTLSIEPRVASPQRSPLERKIAQQLLRGLSLDDESAVRVDLRDAGALDVSVRLGQHDWLNFRSTRFDRPPPFASRTLQLLAVFLTLLVLSGLFIARRMARPMADLARAAERFGLGQSSDPLPENGPREVRDTIRAFNQMQQRLHRLITERSQMLAAVSHDLRTPITTLRLRAEYIENADMRKKHLPRCPIWKRSCPPRSTSQETKPPTNRSEPPILPRCYRARSTIMRTWDTTRPTRDPTG